MYYWGYVHFHSPYICVIWLQITIWKFKKQIRPVYKTGKVIDIIIK